MKDFDIFCVSESKVIDGTEIKNVTTFNLENRTTNYKKNWYSWTACVYTSQVIWLKHALKYLTKISIVT